MSTMQILAVAVATLVAFMIGGLWYGALFNKAWLAEQGWSEDEERRAKANSKRLFATTLVCEAIVATVLVHVLSSLAHDPATTLMVALGTAVGFVIPTMVMNHGYAQRSLRLVLIDAGHWLAVFLAMGVVFIVLRV